MWALTWARIEGPPRHGRSTAARSHAPFLLDFQNQLIARGSSRSRLTQRLHLLAARGEDRDPRFLARAGELVGEAAVERVRLPRAELVFLARGERRAQDLQ